MSNQSGETKGDKWTQIVKCGECGETVRLGQHEEVAGGFRIRCDKCDNVQVYGLSDLDWMQIE